MKELFSRKNIAIVAISAVIIIAAVILCLFILSVGNQGKRPIPTLSEEVTTAPLPATTAPTTTTPATTTTPEITTAEPTTTTVTTTEDTKPTTTTTEPTKLTVTPPDREYDEEDYKGVVFLTFDDGPSRLTPQVLDILKEYGVKATFFVVGSKAEDRYSTIQRAIDEGHQIAMHGYSHTYEEIYTSVDAATNNFFKENQQLMDALGIDARIIRFPGGSSNTVSKNYCKNVMSNSAAILTEAGYNYFDWNVSSGDAGSAVNSSEEIYNRVISGVSTKRSNVVLMHDGNGHEATVAALPAIIEELLKEGYRFGVLTDDIPPVRHTIAN